MVKMNTSSRRNFIKVSAVTTLGFTGLWKFVNGTLVSPPVNGKVNLRYGPLMRDPKGLINLPKGFSYKIISTKGDLMSDGLLVPGRADGMGAFAGLHGRTIIIRNHENSADDFEESAFGLNNNLLSKVKGSEFYDYGKGVVPSLGGTTTFIYNPKTQLIEKQFLSLAGTERNCAGGITPWGTWLSCEESTIKAGGNNNAEKDHGYVFEVPATNEIKLWDAIPIKEMGRMNHEAVSVDPRTGIVFLTEDRPDSLIYRYIPNVPDTLLKGGKLQALEIKGKKSYDTRNWNPDVDSFPVSKKFDVSWIDINEVDSDDDSLRIQGFDKGAACFARGEGMWFGKNELFFACTNGGKNQNGQIFRYTPSLFEGTAGEFKQPGSLELFAEPNDKEILKSCDNLTIAPWGDVITCEDDPHPFIVGITTSREYYKIAENVGFPSEFAGGVFSATGETYFVNIQEPGITLAITGPWL